MSGRGAGPGPRVYTIGHSTREFADFAALLEREHIRRLVDVRTYPASRRHPHFNREALAAGLARRGIAYEHAPALGGLRKPRPDSANTAWRNEGFRGYADHMETAEFRAAIRSLEEAAGLEATTVMCAEAAPLGCHRALLSDALVARGAQVLHILDVGIAPHALTPFARIEGGELRYVADESGGQQELFGGAPGAGPALPAARRGRARR